MQTIFIDRKKEIEGIVTALKNLKERGQGRAILITGEPGIGKTRLLLEAGKIASEERILVAQQKCTPENKTPFGIVKAIVRELTKKLETGELEQLLPVGLAIEKEERVIAMEGVVSEQYRIFENLYRNLVELSKHSPLCLLLDDLQWADSGTIGFLHYLARNIGKTKIVVLATASELDVQNQFLETTVKAMNVEKILKILRLKPLSPQDTATLVKESLKIEVSEKMLKKLHEKTSGNPLFILEIVESLRERAEKMESLERVMIPQTLRAAYQKRIETLDKNSKEIMCLL
ncbi:MAG: AAA family ATPase, partial [Thermoplasmata archaeon]